MLNVHGVTKLLIGALIELSPTDCPVYILSLCSNQRGNDQMFMYPVWFIYSGI